MHASLGHYCIWVIVHFLFVFVCLFFQVKKEVMAVLHHSARSRDSLPENAG